MSAEPGDSRPEPPLPSRIVLRGGTIHDPAHGRDGVVDDVILMGLDLRPARQA